MRHSVGGRDSLDGLEAGTEAEIAGYVTAAIGDGALALKEDWRAQIEGAGLGARLGRTIRSEVYPKGQTSVDAAALIWTKAPKILDAYGRGAMIRTVNGGRYLWIPSDEVPKKRQGNRLNPDEVEARFGRELIVINPGHWRMKTTTSAAHRGVAYAGFDGLAVRKSSGRWRNASRNEQTKGHRSFRESTRQFVIMFTLVPLVRVKKRWDPQGLATAAEARYPGQLSRRWR